MKLVIVNTAREWGGAERYTADLARGLARRGHEVHAVLAPGGRLLEVLRDTDVTAHPLDLGLEVGWHAVLGPVNYPLNWAELHADPRRERLESLLVEIARDGHPDLLHAQHLKEKLWVTEFAYERGIPVAWTAHAPLEPWMRTAAPGRVHTTAGSLLDGLVAVCRATMEDYVAFGIAPVTQAVVYNGIDLEHYASGDRAAIREALGVRDDECAVLMLARPYEGKGVGVLIEALQLLNEGAPGGAWVRAFVAGTSSHVDEFRQRAEAAGLGDRMTFLGHRDDVPDLLAACDVATLPSFYEGLPYAISEAMAASKPVVATRVGGIPEMIEDGASGLLVEARDARGLADALRRLADDPGSRAKMGARARQLAESRFTLEAMIAGSEAAFLDTVTAAAGRPKS